MCSFVASVIVVGLTLLGAMPFVCTVIWHCNINSLTPERYSCDLKLVIFKPISNIVILSISCAICKGLQVNVTNTTDEEWKLVQVITWYCQVTSHHLNQYWPSSVMSFGVTRTQWWGIIWSKEGRQFLLLVVPVSVLMIAFDVACTPCML